MIRSIGRWLGRLLQWPMLAPLLLAIQQVFMIFALNVESVPVGNVVVPMFVSILVAIVVAMLAWAVLRDVHKAAGTTSVFMLMFFSYRDIVDWLSKTIGMEEASSETLVLFLVAGVLVLFGTAGYRLIRNYREMSLFFNALGILFFLYSIYILANRVIENGVWRGGPVHGTSVSSPQVNPNRDEAPDIYYIILDAYGSNGTLQTYYDFDNSNFIRELEKMGFYVAGTSNSNYIQTSLSLCSTMNLDYIRNIKVEGKAIRKHDQLYECIHNSQIRHFLSEQGYRVISFQTPYEFISLSDADIFYTSARPSKFATLVLDASMARMLRSVDVIRNWLYDFPYREHQKIILNIFDNLKSVPQIEGSYFVFAHVIAPHPPFVFDEHGSIEHFTTRFTLGDASDYIAAHSRQEYLVGYRAQIQYVNRLVLDTVSTILKDSKNPPIIILQGDHGPGAYLDWESQENTKLDERFGILSAYYFPNQAYGRLYPSISPVNSFRVIFDDYFGEDYDLLSDLHYFSTWSLPLKFTQVDPK